MAQTIKIGDRLVGEGLPCYFIAEAGVNHNGDPELARQLIDVAARAGADAVKFQKRTVEDILVQEALDAPYTGRHSLGSTYGEHRRALELSPEVYVDLVAYAKQRGITFLCSVWDEKSADFIDSLGIPAFKMPAADLTNLPLLDHVAKKGKPVILSTGMSTLEEVGEAVEVVRRHTDQIVLLHCVSTYPCNPQDINLRVMDTLRKEFGLLVGYSGHEKVGFAITEAAVALGAVVVERHFTLDRSMSGPDHAASLEPMGLERLLVHLRQAVEPALGSPQKVLSDAEMKVRARLAKSVAAACDIPEGTVITACMLKAKGPGSGIRPKHIPDLCGKMARRNIAADTLLPLEALEW